MDLIDKSGILSGISTPFWYYDMNLLSKTVESLRKSAAEHDIKVHYALKANCEEKIVRKMASSGFGADCVSYNEVCRALECGIEAGEILYAGVGKNDFEIIESLKKGVTFNCESIQEIQVLDTFSAKLGKKADICVRINPDIDAHTAKSITSALSTSKFGISSQRLEECIGLLKKCRNINFKGIHFHLGSQITDINNVFGTLCIKANETASFFESNSLKVKEINLGGGLGINYQDPDKYPLPDFNNWLEVIDSGIERGNGRIIRIEPGRSLVAQCCCLVSKVLFTKSGDKNDFIVLDAGMNDLMRPALYGSYHKIENLSAMLFRKAFKENSIYDIVGPICESSDTWGKARMMPLSLRGDMVAIRSAGAYGSSMSSNYNMRDKAKTIFSDEL